MLPFCSSLFFRGMTDDTKKSSLELKAAFCNVEGDHITFVDMYLLYIYNIATNQLQIRASIYL